jgi:hypothetical protein
MSEQNETIKILAYGRWCTRKTLQIHYLIERYGKDKVWVVSADGGLETIAGELDDNHVFRVDTKDEMDRTWARVMTGGKEGKIPPDAWICVDGLTRAAGRIEDFYKDGLDECATYVVTTGKASVPNHLRPFLRFVNSDGLPDNQAVYGPIGTDLKLMINNWAVSVNRYANVYVTAHEQESSNGRTQGPPYMPDLPGKVARNHVMGSFDYVMRFVVDKGKCVAQMDPERINSLYWSRTREAQAKTGVLPKEIHGFDIVEFVEGLRGGKWLDAK